MQIPNFTRHALAGAVLTLAAAAAPAASLVGLTDTNTLLRFDSATPGVSTAVAITGLGAGESIVSIDYRNPDNTLYGLSTAGNLYALSALTGAASLTGTSLVPAVTAGVSYEIDWNPSNNNLRLIGNAAAPNTNRAYTFTTGATAVQTALSYASGPGSPDVVGTAYASNFAGSPAATLSLYFIDALTDALYVNTNAFAGGVLTKVADLTLGGFSFGVNNPSGFEITAAGDAFVSWRENLYAVNLGTAALTPLGSIGPNFNVIGLTSAAAVPEPQSYVLMGMGLLALGARTLRRRSVA
jgi:hypothetical protein